MHVQSCTQEPTFVAHANLALDTTTPVTMSLIPGLLVDATSHYEDPSPSGCQSGEVKIQIQGVKGDFCSPACTGTSCPTDVPTGVTAKPTCALQVQGHVLQVCMFNAYRKVLRSRTLRPTRSTAPSSAHPAPLLVTPTAERMARVSPYSQLVSAPTMTEQVDGSLGESNRHPVFPSVCIPAPPLPTLPPYAHMRSPSILPSAGCPKLPGPLKTTAPLVTPPSGSAK